MARKFTYVSADRIISKIYRDLGIEEISETDMIEWTGEALEGIGAITLYEEAVAFVEVENHTADLPCGLHSIMQVARNNFWSKDNKSLCPANIITDCETEDIKPGCGCAPGCKPVPLDCKGSPLTDYEVAYYRPYFDLQYEYWGWMGSNYYRTQYTPVRLSNNSFFGTVVYPEDQKLYHSAVDEYTLSGGKLTFSFKEGSVAIAYNRQVVDQETGYPMIPDDYSVITAITMYIIMKYMARMWYMGREGYSDKFQKAEQDWQFYCKQAGNTLLMIYGEDEHQQQLDGRKQMIPDHNKYYRNFGNLGYSQSNIWKGQNRNTDFYAR